MGSYASLDAVVELLELLSAVLSAVAGVDLVLESVSADEVSATPDRLVGAPFWPRLSVT
jgi:hypothetical protein